MKILHHASCIMLRANNLTVAIIISAIVHVGIFAAFTSIYYNRSEQPLGSEDGLVTVEVVGEEGGDHREEARGQHGDPVNSTDYTRLLRGPSTMPGTARNDNQRGEVGEAGTPEPSFGSTPNGSPSGNPILAHIRAKIARARYYPPEARRQGIEGRPEVSFKIAPDGSIETIQVLRSSGNEILDSAAVETVKRAVPLPYYEGPITLAIRFVSLH